MKTFVVLCVIAGVTQAQWDPNVSGNRQALVHLFEWKWSDVAAECERFLSGRSYGGVQVSPPNENVVVYNTDYQRPWWERYQPVSYILVTRSGDESGFRSMVQRCNNAGVRIYVDAVINHMSAWWPDGTGATAGSSFDPGAESYPSVPYSYLDFNDGNCYTASGDIENYQDPNQVRNCKLSGLNDLNQGTEYVRQQLVNYFNNLISMGVAGFRIDAGKHMWPGDLQIIFDRLNDLSTDYFPAGTRPFIYLEVIDNGGEPITANDYTGLGRVTEFKYGKELGRALHGGNQLKWFYNFGEAWGFIGSSVALPFIDNHDNQRNGDPDIITFREPKHYKMAVGYMLAWPYGYPRVMSSYDWPQDWVNGQDVNNWIGPPHDGSYNTLSPTINPDDTCGNGWVCEHRWRQIYNMVEFRNVTVNTGMNDWWDNGNNQIAFCRGGKGFVALNNEGADLKQTLQTCLTAGTYCDVISGSLESGSCTGKTVDVGSDGKAYIEILNDEYDGILAIHANSRSS